MSATLTLFPLLGRTPPPWRRSADVMTTSLGTHAAYVAAVDDATRGRTRADGSIIPIGRCSAPPRTRR